MAHTNELLETDLKTECSRCGRDCGDGYQERKYPDSDAVIICGDCADEEEFGLCDECGSGIARNKSGHQMVCDACNELTDEDYRDMEADLAGDMERDDA